MVNLAVILPFHGPDRRPAKIKKCVQNVRDRWMLDRQDCSISGSAFLGPDFSEGFAPNSLPVASPWTLLGP